MKSDTAKVIKKGPMNDFKISEYNFFNALRRKLAAGVLETSIDNILLLCH
jgi:hypothetical protein